MVKPEFFERHTLKVARELLGVALTYNGCQGIIVETEAYRGDPASHARRPNQGALIRETWGRIYIYLIYGMHRCLNFTCETEHAGAVLIRALEPTRGIDAMRARRRTDKLENLTSGPAKLFQAMGLDADLHGRQVLSCLGLKRLKSFPPSDIVAGPRIGISKAKGLNWRFHVRNNPYVSR